MKRLILGVILLLSNVNAKWISVSELRGLSGKTGELKDIRNKSFKLKFVAKIMELEMTTDNNGNINGFAGNIKARIIKRIPKNTSVRC